MSDFIVVKGARAHNLKNISVKIPKGRITVITGLSGSGKSTLAFDTIFAEGQRRYVESLSSYARQFFGTLQKPDVDLIEGLVPALSIDQKSAARSPRSTVATMSEIYDYIRLLFARIGKSHCPICKLELVSVKELPQNQRPQIDKKEKNHKTHLKLYCRQCLNFYHEPTIGTFSFNTPQGACPNCQGLGKKLELDPDLVIPNPRLTLAEGAIRPWSRLGSQEKTAHKILDDFAKITKRSLLDIAIEDMDQMSLKTLLYGSQQEGFVGVLPYLEQKHRETDSDYVRSEIERYMIERICPECNGKRLNQNALAIKINDWNIANITSCTIDKAISLFAKLNKELDNNQLEISQTIIDDIIARLNYLQKVGLHYLALERSSDTLSGGEAQRIRLATQLGSHLTGVLYVLDEPSIGLHPKELDQLIRAIEELRDNGNTVIIVEHDWQMIRAADYVIDIGPGAGIKGGKVVGKGIPNEFIASSDCLTAAYLRGEKTIAIPPKRREQKSRFLKLIGARGNNLKNIDISIPLETFVCITGVSGSGKTTLIRDTLGKALSKYFFRAKTEPAEHDKIEGLEFINKVINVDQSPIGRTPRSNPATYTNVFSAIREIYMQLPLAIERKYGIGHFSFNVRGGRCESCRGDGLIRHEMHFLPDVYVTCEECGGTRYNTEVLDVTYEGQSIADVLEMTINEAYNFFKQHPAVIKKLDILVSVGLGYLQLGQPANTLSGGEAQRIKLATELSRQDTGKTLYILDEPTTGLHFEDINRLLLVLQALVDKGNSVLVIEHNLDVIKSADWVIDLGPEGGEKGGHLVAAGTPEDVSLSEKSLTAQYLRGTLKNGSSNGTPIPLNSSVHS